MDYLKAAPAVTPDQSADVADQGTHQQANPAGGQQGSGTPPMRAVSPEQVYGQIAQARKILEDPAAPLDDEARAELRAALEVAVVKAARWTALSEQGEARDASLGLLSVAATGIVADDATGIGVADDVLLPFLGLAALATLVLTSSPASQEELNHAANELAAALEALSQAGVTALAVAVNGAKLCSNTRRLAEHLARLLGLGSVGGVPSGEPPGNGDGDKHWWHEIKAFLKNIQDGLKGASYKQVMRELLKDFTEEQIDDIALRLVEAAKKMGERPPPFLPPK